MNLLLLLAALPTVLSTPPVVVSILAPATAHYISQSGTIYACADQSYGLYVQPLNSKSIAFYYIAPPNSIHASDKEKYFVTCIAVK